MRFPLSWLAEYVALPSDEETVARAFTLSGTEVEGRGTAEGETVFEFGITVNRPDCMNVYGLAREASVLFRTPLGAVETSCPAGGPPVETLARVEVEASDLCPRYMARVLRGVRVGPSPAWVQKRLLQCGLRPINAVVDATNYVLLEMGHPLHAFDMAFLEGGRIVVRRARMGENILALDGAEKSLREEMLVIADARSPVAVAGVMGGEKSGVTALTCDVLLEGAVFDPVSVRRTAKALGLHTDASHRFERGVDFDGPVKALDRCARLILEACGGTLAGGALDICPVPRPPVRLFFRQRRVHRVVGLDISSAACAAILERLGCGVQAAGEGALEVTVPGWRVDLAREVDLIEEIVRIHGLDDLPATLPRVVDPVGGKPDSLKVEEVLRDLFAAAGYFETIQMSFTDPAVERLLAPALEPAPLANPMAETSGVLRTTLSGGLLGTTLRNRARGARRMALFEVGGVFLPAAGAALREEPRAAALLYDDDPPKRWGEASPRGLLSLKGLLEAALVRFGSTVAFRPSDREPYAAGHSLALMVDGREAGHLGTVDPRLLSNLGLRGRVHLAEFALAGLDAASARVKFRPVSKYPAIVRDFSILAESSVTWEQVRRPLESLSLKHLASVDLVEVYEGGSLPPGTKSWTFSMAFQALDRTLEEGDVRDVPALVEKALRIAVRAVIRSGDAHAV